ILTSRIFDDVLLPGYFSSIRTLFVVQTLYPTGRCKLGGRRIGSEFTSGWRMSKQRRDHSQVREQIQTSPSNVPYVRPPRP
ncbi:unnamed protein product, partial [Nesidiocoris tenuis]